MRSLPGRSKTTFSPKSRLRGPKFGTATSSSTSAPLGPRSDPCPGSSSMRVALKERSLTFLRATLMQSVMRSRSSLRTPTSQAVDVKKLEPKSAGLYRLRRGKWRAIFELDKGGRFILVQRVDDRRDAY